jgi:glycosyltransferase involved in cell wall biosynthesis
MLKADTKKYYIAELYDTKTYTANVRLDDEKILSAMGYKALRFRHYKNNSLLTRFSRLLNSFYFLIRCPRQSIVAFHFPFNARMYAFLLKLFKKKGIKTIAIIIDIDGWRDGDDILFKKEISQLSRFDFLIVHNESMEQELRKSLSASKMYSIEIFDYPLSLPIRKNTIENNICIAANFNKGAFVYQLGKISNINFILYGEGFNPLKTAEADNISYKGLFNPADLKEPFGGSFGLIWDGDSIETCSGNTGRYLQFNNPYKLSFYIAAGLPVITWEKSAIAGFIKNNHIGFTVNSLFDLEEKLNSVSKDDYTKLKQNCDALASKVCSGYFLKRVIKKIENDIN